MGSIARWLPHDPCRGVHRPCQNAAPVPADVVGEVSPQVFLHAVKLGRSAEGAAVAQGQARWPHSRDSTHGFVRVAIWQQTDKTWSSTLDIFVGS